ncbi:MAG: peptidase S41, partial [Lutibacter sp.]|nr:peptidase S41 [Lutibacter sp.]
RLSTINQLYVLTSGSTASASEMIINGLKPFITVKVIGSTTYGKNVGSITLYDSPSSEFTDENSANSSHLNAMQPIVFQIFNKLGQSDYTLGFVPDIEVLEYQSWNNILQFGDENEIVLKTALDDIRGLSSKSISYKYNNLKAFEVKELENKFEKEMYIDAEFLNK